MAYINTNKRRNKQKTIEPWSQLAAIRPKQRDVLAAYNVWYGIVLQLRGLLALTAYKWELQTKETN
jgi:hypothetical protein